MNTEELATKLKEFVGIAEELPERYREKCFEVLLRDYLWGLRETSGSESRPTRAEPLDKASVPKFVVPIGVRALLQQYDISEDLIPKMFVVEGGDIQSAYKLKTTKMAEAQIQLALLTALESALKPGGKFEFAMETVRQRCRDHAVYDQPNFKTIFKNNSRLFKSLKDEDHVELSVDGKAELAETVLAVTK